MTIINNRETLNLETITKRIEGQLIVPNIYPDELLQGYVARIGQINGLCNFAAIQERFSSLYSEYIDPDSKISTLALVSALSKTTPSYLLQNHTLFRKLDNIGSNTEQLNIPNSKLTTLHSSFMKSEISLCESCVAEDIDYIGLSYWRRSHHMHCVNFCSKHEQILISFSKKRFLLMMPHQVVKLNQYLHIDDKNDSANKLVRNYIYICEEFLYRDIKLDLQALLQHLKIKAAILNLRICSNGKKPLLSDIISEQFPMSWLVKNFKYFSKKKRGVFLTGIDCCLSRKYKNFNINSCLLAVSVLDPVINFRSFEFKNTNSRISENVTIPRNTFVQL